MARSGEAVHIQPAASALPAAPVSETACTSRPYSLTNPVGESLPQRVDRVIALIMMRPPRICWFSRNSGTSGSSTTTPTRRLVAPS